MNPPPEQKPQEEEALPLNGLVVSLSWPSIACFGCTARSLELPALLVVHEPAGVRIYQGGAAGRFQIGTVIPSLSWTIRDFAGGTLFLRLDETDAELLARADSDGWRKITLYGRTLYVCGNCRKSRNRPEWEQRLTGKNR